MQNSDCGSIQARTVDSSQETKDCLELEFLRVALEAAETNHTRVQQLAEVGSWERALATNLLTYSPEVFEITGLDPTTFDGTLESFLWFVIPEDRLHAVSNTSSDGSDRVEELTYRLALENGEIRTIHELSRTVFDSDGIPSKIVGISRDVSKRVKSDHQQALLARAVEDSEDAIMILGRDRRIDYVNPSFTRIYGKTADEIVGEAVNVLGDRSARGQNWAGIGKGLESGNSWSGLITHRRSDGARLDIQTSISSIFAVDGKVENFVQIDRDITHQFSLENANSNAHVRQLVIEAVLGRLRATDSADFIARLACDELLKLEGVGAALVIEAAGDKGEVLAMQGEAASRCWSEGDRSLVLEHFSSHPEEPILVNRLAGGHVRHGKGIAERLPASNVLCYEPIRHDMELVAVIGVASVRAKDSPLLLQLFPTISTITGIVGRALGPRLVHQHYQNVTCTEIEVLISNSAFVSRYQPIVNLTTGMVVGYEALTRFAGDEGPDAVFARAASVGLGLELEVATLGAAICTAFDLPTDLYTSLNVSPELAVSGRLVPLLVQLTTPVVLEVTEHVSVTDYGALRKALEELGPNVRVSVDDAGSGFASLRHILELAPNYVKLDIFLIAGIASDPAKQALVAGLVHFAGNARITLIAEGIDSVEDLAKLKFEGVNFGQGFLLHLPQNRPTTEPWPTHVPIRIDHAA